MDQSTGEDVEFEKEQKHLFWQSEIYSKSYFRDLKTKKFRYYDNFSVFNYLFFSWISRWVHLLSKKYIEPYKFHPLPVSDQILIWEPIFSKHVSDGLVRLDSYHYAKSQSRDTKGKKPYKSILLRALALTIWKRALFLVIGLIVVNVLSMSIAILVKKDHRITKCNDIYHSKSVIKKMFNDDIALNSLNETSDIITIDTAGFMATFYIFLRICNSMFLVQMSIGMFGMGYASFKRVNRYIKDCSPNFYISDNKFRGSTDVRSIISDTTTQLPNDVVVYYKDATFTWVHTRDDLLSKNYELYLKNINFELKRGEIAIVTGTQGSGKSNFIKSMLGEMTLVGGSMAVVPLHISMPIFYASQDIFLQHGTIRSNIVFGYRFDERLYKTVLKAVELEYDISTWEKGDLRVVSDNAPSLSGGQRVRMELARAVYAYLIFHKVNEEYNNTKCSFLMCLDASFHGLDPYVSKTIFNNLFNLKTGLLAKEDLSVVLTTSKQTLEDFVNNNKVNNEDYMYLLASSSGPYHMSYLSNDMLRLCSSDAATRLGRMEVTRSKYSKSFKSYTRDESYGRNSDLLECFMEHSDYRARCKFVLYSLVSWSSILFNWIFSFATLLILILLITLDNFTKVKLKVGYFSLALSLSLSLVKSFEKFSSIFSKFMIAICSVERFQYFIPPGNKLKFDKFFNTHEEYVVNPVNKNLRDLDKEQLLRRRAIEFKADSKKFYCLKRLWYHPKLTIIDPGHYLTPEHSGVELKDVCVYTTSFRNTEGMILKHVSASAHKSEIIGMVGRTGAGKTTLLSVLQNIISNRTGQVLLDGKDLNDIPKVVLRQIIGVLPQHPFVFKGWTVRRFLDPRKLFTDDDIKHALNRCGLLNFVSELQGGNKLDTVLVQEDVSSCYQQYKHKSYDNRKSGKMSKTGIETDMLLSNSQLSTLLLARLVLYRHFYRMIVVDEPPEEDLLDESSTKDDIGVPIYDLLEKYFSHCTTIVTAHEVNTLKKCTSVWVIHDGSLVRTCKASDIAANESIASIIEESVKYSQ
ncbi:hypothetical protein MACJ_000522 [Theileria orientalis]|uniref:AAA+ ATPase domain-containing protein n=1 Tax=Theileria orientalis TaxID=68886 RepID=A0A976M464_THEOR|nr:hypothetical protein MACJ_000522 [Theileria orientalis]